MRIIERSREIGGVSVVKFQIPSTKSQTNPNIKNNSELLNVIHSINLDLDIAWNLKIEIWDFVFHLVESTR